MMLYVTQVSGGIDPITAALAINGLYAAFLLWIANQMSGYKKECSGFKDGAKQYCDKARAHADHARSCCTDVKECIDNDNIDKVHMIERIHYICILLESVADTIAIGGDEETEMQSMVSRKVTDVRASIETAYRLRRLEYMPAEDLCISDLEYVVNVGRGEHAAILRRRIERSDLTPNWQAMYLDAVDKLERD